MRRLLPFFIMSSLVISSSKLIAQVTDSTKNSSLDSAYSSQHGFIDSLRVELKKIERSYYLFKDRVDTTKDLTEADRQELQKLSESLEMIGGQIRELTNNASQLADEAAGIYDLESVHIEKGDYTLDDGQTVDDNIEVLNGDALI